MDKTIGDKINELLEIRDMKQMDLARATGISSGHISDLCNNKKTSVMVDTLQKIARALNIHSAYFLEDDTIGPADILPHLTEEQREFVLDPKRSLPWIGISEEADRKGMSPDKIRQIIKIVSE